MNFKNVFKSIQETGGASFNLDTGELNPTKGYMVSVSKDYERKFVIPTNFADFATIFNSYMLDHWERLIEGAGTFVGFWIYDRHLFLDLAENIADFEEAYQKGFDREQIAIYDCAKKRDITITYMYPY